MHNGANVISVDRETGALRWITQVETHPAAVITGSPVVFDGVVYIGVSSNEEILAAESGISVLQLSRQCRGARCEERCDALEDLRHAGQRRADQADTAAVRYGNRPRLIHKRGTLFIGTGNNYTAPADVEACQNATPTANCAAPDDFFDTALALDLKTGRSSGQRSCKALTLGQ